MSGFIYSITSYPGGGRGVTVHSLQSKGMGPRKKQIVADDDPPILTKE